MERERTPREHPSRAKVSQLKGGDLGKSTTVEVAE